MTAVPKGRRRAGVFAGLVAVAAGLIFVLAAATASLPGSNFEIDASANLIQNDPSPSIDWASASVVSPAQVNKQDTPSGQNDDSYSGSTKEDSICPAAVTGSIPNNKSDLLTFGAYVESEVGGPGFLNLFWRRVNDPSGTTLMDFELNKSSTNCANSPNKVRTVGDLLLEYSIDQGGAVATITAREWSGSAWGPKIELPGQALGTINNAVIPANQSDGLSSAPIAARTFGEMQLDLDFIFDEGNCESFGSAMVKSRSSDSFTSQMKDFIAPVPVNITNCGKVIIRKETDPDESPNATNFGYTKSFATDPVSGAEFSLQDDGSESFDVILGSDYSVEEDVVGAGYDFDNVDCSDSTGVSPTITDALVEFDIDSAQDILDCTYTNKARGSIVIRKVTQDSGGSFDFDSQTLSPSAWTLAPADAGEANAASREFNDLAPGNYDAVETVPNGWNLVSATCSDGDDPSAISLAGGQTITCTFVNARERGAILIQKYRKHAADGPGDHPQSEVDFTISGGDLEDDISAETNGDGVACVGGLLLSDFAGDYVVTESVPAGYDSADAEQTVSVVAEGSCAAGATQANVRFDNIPLTNVTISVDSQIDGGTASVIQCGDGDPVDTDADGDGSVTVLGLRPTAPDVTLTCTVIVDP